MTNRARTIDAPRAGSASTETVILYLIIAVLVMLTTTIFARNLLRRASAVTQSLDRSEPVNARRVHFYRDYEDILGRRETFPTLYDLHEQGGVRHDGLQYAGARLRHDDGTVTVIECGVDSFGDSKSLVARTDNYAESSFLGEDNDLDNSLHAVGIDLSGDRWLEGHMKFRPGEEFAIDDPAASANLQGSGTAGFSGGGTWYEGEGTWALYGEEVAAKARLGGVDFSLGGGRAKDGKRTFAGLTGGLSGVGLEVEMRKTLKGDAKNPDGARLDLVGSLTLGEVSLGALVGAGAIQTKRQQFSGAGASGEAGINGIKIKVGLEYRTDTRNYWVLGRGQLIGTVALSAQAGAGINAQVIAGARKSGATEIRAGSKVTWGPGAGVEFSLRHEPR